MIVLELRRGLLGYFSSMAQDFSYSEISQFYSSALRQENVLAFEVSMDDLSIMDVLYCKTNLSEPFWFSRVYLKLCFRRKETDFVSAALSYCPNLHHLHIP